MDITHDRAREVASRLIAGSFRRDGERLDDDKRPRFSIPTRIDHDDDTVIVAYIDQQREKDATITALRKRVEELEGAANGEREWLKKQVFALCEDTTEKYHDAGQRDTEGKEGAFARGRCIEAKSIARAIGDVCRERARAARRAKGGEDV